MKEDNGVISLEACLVVPAFIILILFCYGFFIWFCGDQIMIHAAYQSVESLSLDSYSNDRLYKIADDGETSLISSLVATVANNEYYNEFKTVNVHWYKSGDKSDVHTAAELRVLSYISSAADEDSARDEANSILECFGIKDGFDSLDFSDSEVKDGTLTLTINYTQSFLFDFNGLLDIPRKITVQSHMW